MKYERGRRGRKRYAYSLSAERAGTCRLCAGRAAADDGKVVEHWDVLQRVPESSANDKTMF
jgi:hypothetical protein